MSDDRPAVIGTYSFPEEDWIEYKRDADDLLIRFRVHEHPSRKDGFCYELEQWDAIQHSWRGLTWGETWLNDRQDNNQRAWDRLYDDMKIRFQVTRD